MTWSSIRFLPYFAFSLFFSLPFHLVRIHLHIWNILVQYPFSNPIIQLLFHLTHPGMGLGVGPWWHGHTLNFKTLLIIYCKNFNKMPYNYFYIMCPLIFYTSSVVDCNLPMTSSTCWVMREYNLITSSLRVPSLLPTWKRGKKHLLFLLFHQYSIKCIVTVLFSMAIVRGSFNYRNFLKSLMLW